MIWILLYLVITSISILVCYYDAKRYHYTVKFFLEECIFSIFLFPITILFLISRFLEFLKINIPEVKINTEFITKFLNKKL